MGLEGLGGLGGIRISEDDVEDVDDSDDSDDCNPSISFISFVKFDISVSVAIVVWTIDTGVSLSVTIVIEFSLFVTMEIEASSG